LRVADQRFTSVAAPGSPPVALRAPSGKPGAIPTTFGSFRISILLSKTQFNLKFVSRKIGVGAFILALNQSFRNFTGEV
jgi:hypothetical protein